MPSIVLHLLLVLSEEDAFWLLCTIFEDLIPDHMGYKGSNSWMGGVHDVGKEACKTLLENLVDDICPHFWKYLEDEEGDNVRAEVLDLLILTTHTSYLIFNIALYLSHTL